MNPESEQAILQVSHLSKACGGVQAVDDLSFAVRGGEIFGFLGPNGAGKTATIKMMCGLLRPDLGSITIKGCSLQKEGWKGSCRIGVCPQNIVIWEAMTCLEQLEFMGRMYDVEARRARRKAEELLEVFGLVQKGKKLARTLSGGMQRRLNIALALTFLAAVHVGYRSAGSLPLFFAVGALSCILVIAISLIVAALDPLPCLDAHLLCQ